jgi:hypothetical protein
LGTAWQDRGHDVTFSVRNPDDPKWASLGTVRGNEAAASDADVVVLCTSGGTDFGFGLLRGRA